MVSISDKFDNTASRVGDLLNKNPLISDVVAMSIIAVIVAISSPRIISIDPFQQDYTRVSKIADINKDKITSPEEWGLVYGELGVPFNYQTYNPKKDFTIYDLERFLERRRQ